MICGDQLVLRKLHNSVETQVLYRTLTKSVQVVLKKSRKKKNKTEKTCHGFKLKARAVVGAKLYQ